MSDQKLGIFSYFAEIDADGSGLLDREEVRGRIYSFLQYIILYTVYTS